MLKTVCNMYAPLPGFFSSAAESMGLAHDECIMVGDDVAVDIGGAQDAGMKGVLVRTGKYMDGDEGTISTAPWATADTLNDAVDRILEHNDSC